MCQSLRNKCVEEKIVKKRAGLRGLTVQPSTGPSKLTKSWQEGYGLGLVRIKHFTFSL